MSTWFFDLIAPLYDQWAVPLGVSAPDRVLELMELQGHEWILDIGGGTGTLARMIVERSRAQVTVLDASEKMLAQITAHPRLQTVHGTAHSLPFHADQFDWIVCTAAFHWLAPHQTALSAMRRVLKPGGKLFIHDFDRKGVLGPLLTQGEEWLRQGAEYVTQSDLSPMLKEQGFEGIFFPFNAFQFAYVGIKQP